MKRKYLFLVIPALFPLYFTSDSAAQGEANYWYFGQNAGLDFSSGSPVSVSNSQLVTQEGCASISDAAGNLLFYTDGIEVWNKNHTTMPNGTGLMGNWSATQSGVIIQKPGSTNIYYIFTVDAQASPNGIRYSEVNMTLNGGLGDVTANKNILLNSPSCEKITGIRHCNNTDVWVVTHDWNSNAFRAFLVTASGVNTNPVISQAGLLAAGPTSNTIGYLKGSPDGKKLASAIQDLHAFEVFDFDNLSGIVSNQVLLPLNTPYAYGVEFSPDGSKLYCATLGYPANIYQYNLCAGSNSAIAASGVLVATSASTWIGALQLGPDKKIYLARYMDPWLGVINNPNALGTACSYTDNGVALSSGISRLGLPNFVPWYFKAPLPPFTVAMNCLNGNFTSPSASSTNCSVSSNPILSLQWNFGDAASGANDTSSASSASHLFTAPGTYNVTLVLNYACSSDTMRQTVVVTQPQVSITSVDASCGSNDGSATVSVTGGAGTYTYTWTPGGETSSTAAGLGAGVYTVLVSDVNGCTQTAIATIAAPPAPVADAGHDVSIMAGESATLHATGGGSYSWAPAEGLSCINCQDPVASPLETMGYSVTVTSPNGCTDSANVRVRVEAIAFLPNAFTPDNDGVNDIFLPKIPGVRDFSLSIFDRWGEKIFETNDMEQGWNGYYKGDKCEESVYVYQLNFVDGANNKPHQFTGWVALVR